MSPSTPLRSAQDTRGIGVRSSILPFLRSSSGPAGPWCGTPHPAPGALLLPPLAATPARGRALRCQQSPAASRRLAVRPSNAAIVRVSPPRSCRSASSVVRWRHRLLTRVARIDRHSPRGSCAGHMRTCSFPCFSLVSSLKLSLFPTPHELERTPRQRPCVQGRILYCGTVCSTALYPDSTEPEHSLEHLC